MGRPIIDRLAAAGHDVRVLVRRPDAQLAAAADGLTVTDDIAATVRDADVVFVAVLTDEQVRSVCLGPAGAVAAMRPGAVIVAHTTCDPATVELIAAQSARRGIGVLDAALSGGPHNIAAGDLTLWVGGDEALVEQLRPALATYASPVVFVGPIGNGQRVKLVNNALFVAQVGLAIDAVRLAGSVGIEEKTILSAVQHGSGASRAFGVVAAGGSVDAVARLSDWMLEDITVVREVAQRAGADLGIIGTVLSSDAVEKNVLHPCGAPEPVVGSRGEGRARQHGHADGAAATGRGPRIERVRPLGGVTRTVRGHRRGMALRHLDAARRMTTNRHQLAIEHQTVFGLPPVESVHLAGDFDEFAVLAEMVGTRGIRTTIEFAPSLMIADLDIALAAVHYVARTDFRLLIDTMHLVRAGHSAAEPAAIDPALIGYAQLSDHTIRQRSANYHADAIDRMVPGEGELPLPEILATLPRDVVIGLEVPMISAARAGNRYANEHADASWRPVHC